MAGAPKTTASGGGPDWDNPLPAPPAESWAEPNAVIGQDKLFRPFPNVLSMDDDPPAGQGLDADDAPKGRDVQGPVAHTRTPELLDRHCVR